MKNCTILFLLILLQSCSSKKTIPTVYDAERLCKGIEDMSKYIDESEVIKEFHLGKVSKETKLKYTINTNIIEGVPMDVRTLVASIIQSEDNITLQEAEEKIKIKLSKKKTFLKPSCIKPTNFVNPEYKIDYYYYPEYELLTAKISKNINRGDLVFAKIDLNGNIKVLKTGFWQ